MALLFLQVRTFLSTIWLLLVTVIWIDDFMCILMTPHFTGDNAILLVFCAVIVTLRYQCHAHSIAFACLHNWLSFFHAMNICVCRLLSRKCYCGIFTRCCLQCIVLFAIYIVDVNHLASQMTRFLSLNFIPNTRYLSFFKSWTLDKEYISDYRSISVSPACVMSKCIKCAVQLTTLGRNSL